MAQNDPTEIPDVDAALQNALKKSGVNVVPPQVHEVTQRHLASLSKLVAELRAAGVDDGVVRNSTKILLQSYEEELLDVLLELTGDE